MAQAAGNKEWISQPEFIFWLNMALGNLNPVQPQPLLYDRIPGIGGVISSKEAHHHFR